MDVHARLNCWFETDLAIGVSAKGFIDDVFLSSADFASAGFSCGEDVEQFARAAISLGGKSIDVAHPCAEVSLVGDFGRVRLHAVLGGDCAAESYVSIRRHRATSFDLDAVGGDSSAALRAVLEQKQNFLIAGATGVGKTTLLRAMLAECSQERIVVVEDLAELGLRGAVSLCSRMANADGYGEISMAQLLREALRMRPDRLVVGEARGAELAVLLQALNTGHQGAGFTLHANSIDTVVARLRVLLLLGGLPAVAVDELIRASVDWVVFMGRASGGHAVEAILPMSELLAE
jgi:pilus assembly protein CpaF